MGLSQRRRDLLATDRWRPLSVFVERWYAQPLSDADGQSPLEVELVATRLGLTLPAALTEWYELVGRRLRSVQDTPQLLHELEVEDEALRVWTENQGVWSVFAPLDGRDDPICQVRGDKNGTHDEPLSRMLFGMLVSDTIMGGCGFPGSVGELRSTVLGGYCEAFTDAHEERLRSTYRELDFAPNPHFEERYRGDDATLIRFHNNVAIEWMTATDEAFASLDALLDLDPPGGEHEMVVAFAAPTASQLRILTREAEFSMYSPHPDFLQGPLAGVGHVWGATGGESPAFNIRTKQPLRVLELILSAVPSDLLPTLTVATRPAAISAFKVLYPAGTTTFIPPR